MSTSLQIEPQCELQQIGRNWFYSSNRASKTAPQNLGYFNFHSKKISELKPGPVYKVSEDHAMNLENCYDEDVEIEADQNHEIR